MNTAENSNAINYNTASVALTNANGESGTLTDATVEPMGIPVIYDTALNLG